MSPEEQLIIAVIENPGRVIRLSDPIGIRRNPWYWVSTLSDIQPIPVGIRCQGFRQLPTKFLSDPME